jgi:hypothetical protein
MKKIFIVETEDGVPYLHHPDYMARPDVFTSPDNGTKAAWQHLANHFHKKDIYVAVSPHVMKQISEDGRVKNQHETNDTVGGHLDPEMRRIFEHKFFKNNLPSLKDKPLPIYGYMSSHPMSSRWINDSYDPGDHVMPYGAVRLKIKPHLRPVTTFTRDDSLLTHFEHITPSFVTHPHWKSLSSSSLHDLQPYEERRFSPRKNDVINYTTPNESRKDDGNGDMPYHEAQIHSEVHMHDIDSIHVLPSQENSAVDYESIGKRHGIPVHYYNTKGDRVPLEKFRQAKENRHDYD